MNSIQDLANAIRNLATPGTRGSDLACENGIADCRAARKNFEHKAGELVRDNYYWHKKFTELESGLITRTKDNP